MYSFFWGGEEKGGLETSKIIICCIPQKKKKKSKKQKTKTPIKQSCLHSVCKVIILAIVVSEAQSIWHPEIFWKWLNYLGICLYILLPDINLRPRGILPNLFQH